MNSTHRIQTRLTETGTILPMSLQEAKTSAPAIFATSQGPAIKSKAYKFTPTSEIIEHMDTLGYKLIDARQSKARTHDSEIYGGHVVSFQHDKLNVSSNGKLEAKPTIHIINSHNGSGSIRFEMGLFRLVCSNGLVIKQMDMGGFRERHTRYTFQEIKDIIEHKVQELPSTVGLLNKWAQREMTEQERFTFATEALALRLSSDRIPTAQEINAILTPLRPEDSNPDLYHTFNVIQEKVINGGYKLNNRTARGIKNPLRDLNINQALWNLAASKYN
jgi:hypothetical protein